MTESIRWISSKLYAYAVFSRLKRLEKVQIAVSACLVMSFIWLLAGIFFKVVFGDYHTSIRMFLIWANVLACTVLAVLSSTRPADRVGIFYCEP